ncbi:MAG: trypsin-like peptidase domain-containing protein [Bacteroidales bacterium]|nr:trypsin-like peptidase domain-containing protein [Bacteroidales bacterium]
MKKTVVFILLLMLFTATSLPAQFNPVESAKSLVMIKITANGQPSAASGFIWKHDDWVVTSLHAMQAGAQIKVLYLNSYWRDAEVIRVLPKADLVLLKTNLSEMPLNKPVKPVTSFYTGQVKFREKLYAQGYHGGANGHRTQSLEKGDANPETLEYLIVSIPNKKKLKALGFPQIDLPVYFLNGSLLPGYSGAPIYNTDGQLIAIGDGGLENGQINVSWAIPATYLTELESTNSTQLPASLTDLSLLFSAQMQLDEDFDEEKFVNDDLPYLPAENEHNGFEFYKTKNRSFEQMYETSFDPDNLDYFADNFEENNIFIDYSTLRFDIYEDVINGIVVALPEDSRLVYQPESGSYVVDMSDYNLSHYFMLEYVGVHDTEADFASIDDAIALVDDIIQSSYGVAVGGFTIDDDYSYTLTAADQSQVAYLLYQGNNNYYDKYENEYSLVVYLTILLQDSKVFYSIATITMPVAELNVAMSTGIDCVDYYDMSTGECDYFEMLMRVVAATHLTTFANKHLTDAHK